MELPYRLIQLYTFKDEAVLDPFCGSGSACVAAIKAGRHYIGYDTEEEYIHLAAKRIREYKQQSTIPLFVEKESDLAVVRDDQVAYTSENVIR